MLVRASGSSSGLLGFVLHNCCPSAAVAGMVDFRTWEAATVLPFRVLGARMTVPSGTTALTPRVCLSARASAAGILAATALRIQRVLIFVAPTCFSWATSGACMDAAVAARACRWARLAGRFLSWSLKTTTTRFCLPDERALTWLGLNLEMLGVATPAWAAEPAPEPTPITTATTSAAAPSKTTLRGVHDILMPPFSGPVWVLWLIPTRRRENRRGLLPAVRGGVDSS